MFDSEAIILFLELSFLYNFEDVNMMKALSSVFLFSNDDCLVSSEMKQHIQVFRQSNAFDRSVRHSSILPIKYSKFSDTS